MDPLRASVEWPMTPSRRWLEQQVQTRADSRNYSKPRYSITQIDRPYRAVIFEPQVLMVAGVIRTWDSWGRALNAFRNFGRNFEPTTRRSYSRQ